MLGTCTSLPGLIDAFANSSGSVKEASDVAAMITGNMATDVQTQRLLTVREAAEFLSVSEKTVRRLIDARILPAFQTRPHGAIRIDERELEEWLRES
jgi:excisionase family DNA binding protein